MLRIRRCGWLKLTADPVPEPTVAEALTAAALRLQDRRLARALLALALDCAPDEVLLRDHEPFTAGTALDALITRAAQGEPLSRIRGWREFYGLRFQLNPDCLDPRADSELLADLAIEAVGGRPARVLDAGTGTGCLLLATLANCPAATGTGFDAAAGAVMAAQQNAQTLSLTDRAVFLQDTFAGYDGGGFDLVISNPPYIAPDEILAENVTDYDPAAALFAEDRGFACYDVILRQAHRWLAHGSLLMLEHGWQQRDELCARAQTTGWQVRSVHDDLGGNPRVVVLQRVQA